MEVREQAELKVDEGDKKYSARSACGSLAQAAAEIRTQSVRSTFVAFVKVRISALEQQMVEPPE